MKLCISGRIDAYELDSGTYWSYNSSNFNFSDVSGKEYIDPSHSPLYNISDHNVITEQVFPISQARIMCYRLKPGCGENLRKIRFVWIPS